MHGQTQAVRLVRSSSVPATTRVAQRRRPHANPKNHSPSAPSGRLNHIPMAQASHATQNTTELMTLLHHQARASRRCHSLPIGENQNQCLSATYFRGERKPQLNQGCSSQSNSQSACTKTTALCARISILRVDGITQIHHTHPGRCLEAAPHADCPYGQGMRRCAQD